MIDLPKAPPTIRQRIMTVMMARFGSTFPGIEGGAIRWDMVTDRPLSAEEQNRGYALGVYDTSEKKTDLTGAVECRLNIVLEFHVAIAQGDDMMSILRAVLGEVQRVAQLDLNMKEPNGYPLSIDVTEKGNELENIASNATRGSGVVVVEVKYRHKPGKPTERR